MILIVISIWFVLWLLAMAIGNRQRREGHGTVAQLVIRSAVVSGLEMMPVTTGLAMLDLHRFPERQADMQFVTVVAGIICAIWMMQFLRPPARWLGSREELPQIDDPLLIATIRQMSQAMGMAPPVVRRIPDSGATLSVQGFAGGLPAPSVAVSDGVLLRLSTDERNAILAHELGHLANNTLWYFPAAAAIAGTTAVISSSVFSMWIAILFGFAVHTGLLRIVSRHFEFDSDRRAALVVGFRSTVTALDKIHVVSPIDNAGWKSFLAYCVATHPSHEERLSRLTAAAPPADRPDITWSEETARRRRHGSRLAAGLWLIALVTCFVLPHTPQYDSPRFITLLSITILPTMLVQSAIRNDIRKDLSRRKAPPRRNRSLIWIAFAAAASYLGAAWLLDHWNVDYDGAILAVVTFLGVFILTILITFLAQGRFGLQKLRQQINLAIHQRRWHDALALQSQHAKKVSRCPALRHDLALARWMTGERQLAFREMMELRNEHSQFKHPWLTSALMHLENGETETAIDVIQEVQDSLQGDIAPHVITARCFRILGDLDGLKREIDVVEQISPNSASVPALRALLAIDRHCAPEALQQLELGERLSPGDPLLLLIRAEVELRWGSVDAGRLALDKADQLLAATPFAFLGAERQHVERIATTPLNETKELNSP